MKNESTSESLKAIANKANGKVGEMAKKSTEIVKKSKKAVYDAVDVNGDGQVDIEDVILLAFKVPGVAVKRDVFLKQELMGKKLSAIPTYSRFEQLTDNAHYPIVCTTVILMNHTLQ